MIIEFRSMWLVYLQSVSVRVLKEVLDQSSQNT